MQNIARFYVIIVSL